MAAITAKLVKELRDKTSAGMMDCKKALNESNGCLLYTSPSPRDKRQSRMPSSA